MNVKQPLITNAIEVVPRDDQVFIQFEWYTEVDKFKEWWEQEGWELFKKWTETPSEG